MRQFDQPLFVKPPRSASIGIGVAALALASATLLTGLGFSAMRAVPDLYPVVFGGLLFMTVSVPGGFLLSIVSAVIAAVQLGRGPHPRARRGLTLALVGFAFECIGLLTMTATGSLLAAPPVG